MIGLRRMMMAAAGASPPIVEGFAGLVLSHGPWGYWKLDTDASDSSGNGNHGTAAASMTFGQPGLFDGTGTSATAAGTGYRVRLPDMPAPPAAGSRRMTLISCFRTTSTSTQNLISADGAPRHWQFRLAGGMVQAVVLISSANARTVTSLNAYSDGLPHMAVVVFDDSLPVGAGQLKLYVDGDFISMLNEACSYAHDGLPSKPAIGARASTTTIDGFVGSLDDSAVIFKALTETEVAALWAARNTP